MPVCQKLQSAGSFLLFPKSWSGVMGRAVGTDVLAVAVLFTVALSEHAKHDGAHDVWSHVADKFRKALSPAGRLWGGGPLKIPDWGDTDRIGQSFAGNGLYLAIGLAFFAAAKMAYGHFNSANGSAQDEQREQLLGGEQQHPSTELEQQYTSIGNGRITLQSFLTNVVAQWAQISGSWFDQGGLRDRLLADFASSDDDKALLKDAVKQATATDEEQGVTATTLGLTNQHIDDYQPSQSPGHH